MPAAVVFAFAVSDGLSPVVGAAPYDVLARQLPRLLVAHLNGGGDRGVRFFPFLGPVDGQRGFLAVREPFDPAVLAGLHRQGEVQLLVDGVFVPRYLHWRILDGRTHEVLRECRVPFDARHPLDALMRLEFEIGDQLGWRHRPQAPGALTGEALGWWLVLKDTILRREANLLDFAAEPLRPAHRLLDLAPDEAEAHDTVLDLAMHEARRSRGDGALTELLTKLGPLLDSPDRLERLAALAQACGADAVAAAPLVRAARLAPERPELVERAAALLFRLDRYDELAELVQAARAAGRATCTALAQFAAVADRTRDHDLRRTLTDELLARTDLSVPVARLLVSFLLEDERAADARRVAERALTEQPNHALLAFELGRACLLLGDDGEAAANLRRAIANGLPAAVVPEAERMLRLAAVPGLWTGTRAVETALGAGDLDAALDRVSQLVKRVGRVPEALFLLGLVRHKLGHLRRAERALRRVLSLDDAFADAHNRLGILLVARGRLHEGHAHLQRAHQLSPAEASPLLHLAQTSALLGQHDEAQRFLQAAQLAGAKPELLAAVRREIA